MNEIKTGVATLHGQLDQRCLGRTTKTTTLDCVLLQSFLQCQWQCLLLESRCVLIHQYFTNDFFVQKCFAQLLSNYSLALNFFGKKMSAQKLLIKC